MEASNSTGFCRGSAFLSSDAKNSRLLSAGVIRTAEHIGGRGGGGGGRDGVDKNSPATWFFQQMFTEQALCSFPDVSRPQFPWAAWILLLP